MFTAQGPSVLHAIEVAVVQFAQVHLVYITMHGEGFSKSLESIANLYVYVFILNH